MTGGAKIEIYGDVKNVLEGIVSSDNVLQLDLAQVFFALGAGNFSEPHFFGETIVFFHQAFGTILTKEGSVVTEKKIASLTSPFLLGAEISALPKQLISFEKVEFKDILLKWEQKVEYGGFFVADCCFDAFFGAFLKKAPIYGENINENKDKYWQSPPVLKDQWAYLFGVFLTEKGQKHIPHLDRAFYQNPNEKTESTLLSHTHAALNLEHKLAKTWTEMEENFLIADISGVRHFLTHSVLKKGSFAFFELEISKNL